MAYYILPDYCLNHRDRLLAMCQGPPRVANVFYYIMACQALKMEPVIEDGLRFQWRPGKLDDGREYLVMEYPPPQDIGLEAAVLDSASPEQIAKLLEGVVMAPFFSGVAFNEIGEARYLVLAQSFYPGRFTLRECFPDGAHGSLGDGPDPSLENFLACFSKELQLETLFQPGQPT